MRASEGKGRTQKERGQVKEKSKLREESNGKEDN